MAKKIDPTLVFVPTSHAIESKVGDETVILHLENGNYYGLDMVGTRAWTLMHDGASVSTLCRDLLQEYDVAEDILESDLQSFLSDLMEQELIEKRVP